MVNLVLSLGGSVMCPRLLDAEFLSDFVTLLAKHHTGSSNIVIVTGGGALARNYVSKLHSLGVSAQGCDRAGIAATKVHAQVLFELCQLYGLNTVLTHSPTELHLSTSPQVTILGGTVPGHTTDYVAVECAQHLGIDTVVNISNTDGIYDRDPVQKDAQLLRTMSWDALQSLVGDSHSSGMHVPFDPVATTLARSGKPLVAHFVSSSIPNLRHLFEQNLNSLKGTVVR